MRIVLAKRHLMLAGLGEVEGNDQRVGEEEASSPSGIVRAPRTHMMAATLENFMTTFRFENVHDCCAGRKGWTPLRYAVMYFGKSTMGDPILREILEEGAEVEAALDHEDRRVSHTAGFTVLHTAAACGVSVIIIEVVGKRRTHFAIFSR